MTDQSYSTDMTHQPTAPYFSPITGGGERVRTDDLLDANQALSQLSYTPEYPPCYRLRRALDFGGPR
jgi:hypothetical protein